MEGWLSSLLTPSWDHPMNHPATPANQSCRVACPCPLYESDSTKGILERKSYRHTPPPPPSVLVQYWGILHLTMPFGIPSCSGITPAANLAQQVLEVAEGVSQEDVVVVRPRLRHAAEAVCAGDERLRQRPSDALSQLVLGLRALRTTEMSGNAPSPASYGADRQCPN